MTLTDLETFFVSIELPKTISIKQGETITDVPAFINGHIEIVRKNATVPAFNAFYDRLYQLAEVLSDQTEKPDTAIA